MTCTLRRRVLWPDPAFRPEAEVYSMSAQLELPQTETAASSCFRSHRSGVARGRVRGKTGCEGNYAVDRVTRGSYRIRAGQLVFREACSSVGAR